MESPPIRRGDVRWPDTATQRSRRTVHPRVRSSIGLEQAVRDDRFEGVELQLPTFGRHGDRHVVADDPEGDLVDDLGDDGVDLARHDRRSGLHRRQIDLAETGSRPGRQEPKVVADLGQLHRAAFEHAGELDERTDVLGGLDQVGGRDDVDSGDRGEMCTRVPRVAWVGVQAGADGGATQVDLE